MPQNDLFSLGYRIDAKESRARNESIASSNSLMSSDTNTFA